MVMATIPITKNCVGCDIVAFHAARNPDNGAVDVKSNAIQKHLYIRYLEFHHKSKQSLLVNFDYYM